MLILVIFTNNYSEYIKFNIKIIIQSFLTEMNEQFTIMRRNYSKNQESANSKQSGFKTNYFNNSHLIIS